jgi:hypothetical protein
VSVSPSLSLSSSEDAHKYGFTSLATSIVIFLVREVKDEKRSVGAAVSRISNCANATNR